MKNDLWDVVYFDFDLDRFQLPGNCSNMYQSRIQYNSAKEKYHSAFFKLIVK